MKYEIFVDLIPSVRNAFFLAVSLLFILSGAVNLGLTGFIFAVPFLIAFHPSPNDYWRYTEETLTKICEQAGFRDIEIKVVE